MKKQIEVSGKVFTSTELKEQIEDQYNALNGAKWGWSTIPAINAAIKQAEEELSAINGRCPATATKARAFVILRDGKLLQH
jgi:hypothetical protein